MTQVRVNLLTAVNADAVKIERKQIDGENYAVIKDVVWHKDNIVLNGGLYSEVENTKGFQSMEGRIMPFGHPQVNGKYVAISSLSTPEASLALAKHYGGVHTQNVRKEGASYLTDVMVNERLAAAHKDGQLLMDWIGDAEDYSSGGKDKPQAVHMSTGVIANKLMVNGKQGGKNYTWIAENQRYDHLAILFHEEGAGGDDVSIAVNCELVINSSLADAEEAVMEKQPSMFERFMAKVSDRLGIDLQLNAQAVLKSSYGQRRDVISAAIKERFGTKDLYVYVSDFDDSNIVFEYGNSLQSIGYTVDGANIVLDEGAPVDVVTKTEFVTKDAPLALFQNSVECQPESELNQTPSELPMDEAKLKALIDGAIAPLTEQLTAVNTHLAAAQDKVKALEEQIQVNAKSADEENRKVIMAKAPHLELTVNALSGEPLATLAASYQSADNLVPGFTVNSKTAGDLSTYEGV